MKLHQFYIWVTGALTLSFALPRPIEAQIVGDTTLPNNSIVTPIGKVFNIEGGTEVGNNLFHSFKDFSLATGFEAFFNNSLNIENIFSRVTGGNISNIDGLIRANGSANLFLINPNGIIFGSNAQLNVGGSFLASTASQINFANGSFFSATTPASSPLLTVSVPIGLQFGADPGKIVNRANAAVVDSMGNKSTGLQGGTNSTVALVGGEVLFEGGSLTSPGGRIEVGAVGGNTQVSLNQTGNRFALGYEGVNNFRDVVLSDLAQINASGEGGGDIQVRGQNIKVLGGSQIVADTLGDLPGGTVEITASDLVEVSGSGPLPPDGPSDPVLVMFGIIAPLTSTLSTTTFGSGRGGDLIIKTARLITRGGPEIQVQTFGDGQGGDLLLIASESVDISGAKPLVRLEPNVADLIAPTTSASGLSVDATIDLGLSSNISTVAVGAGQGGKLTLITPSLKVGSGSLINSNPFGTGSGGTINIQAGTVELTGRSPRTGLYPSGIITSSLSPGDSGSVTLTVDRLIVRDGAEINAATFSTARGGSLTIQASKSIEVIGTGTATDGQRFSSLLTAGTTGAGDAGNVSITTGSLTVRDGAGIRVSGTKTGDAGILNIRADSIKLDNFASITAATTSGEGGNISIDVRDYLLLRNGSQITGQAEGTGNGGNITIDPPFIIAVKPENSDIIANAFAGNGGNINITATGIYGLVPTRGPLNDSISEINASSQTGIQGTVTINNPEVDPSSGLVKLPEELSDASNQVVVSCAAAQGNSFTITGRGGLPEDPTATIRGQTVWSDLQDFSSVTEGANATPTNNQALTKNRPSRIVEATGWVTDKQGHVTLVAALPNGTASTYGAKPPNCH